MSRLQERIQRAKTQHEEQHTREEIERQQLAIQVDAEVKQSYEESLERVISSPEWKQMKTVAHDPLLHELISMYFREFPVIKERKNWLGKMVPETIPPKISIIETPLPKIMGISHSRFEYDTGTKRESPYFIDALRSDNEWRQHLKIQLSSYSRVSLPELSLLNVTHSEINVNGVTITCPNGEVKISVIVNFVPHDNDHPSDHEWEHFKTVEEFIDRMVTLIGRGAKVDGLWTPSS